MLKKWLPILFILLLALALRTVRLTDIPPGLTHDEANHGREAIEILDGQLRYYFPLNYGSEPLYSYVVAGSMALFGEGLFALRLVNVIFGTATILAMFIWSRAVFGRAPALITAGLIAVSFWPLATSRESLRAGLLPFFMITAVWFFWQIVFPKAEEKDAHRNHTSLFQKRQTWLVAGFALSILITLHIYLASRVAWLLFPIFLLYLFLIHRAIFKRSWRPVVVGLLLAGSFSIPMFIYLANNPQSQTRLSMLGGTLEQITSGNLSPLLQNSSEALLAFIWPGFGDQFLAYNIPGRPVFDWISALFFIIGVVVSLWRWKKPAYAFTLIWFVAGIIPSLVTGSTANTTRNLAALPVVYLFPALGIVFILRHLAKRLDRPPRRVLIGGAFIILLAVGLITARDYFLRWADSPDVRTAYQQTLVEEITYLQQLDKQDGQIVISSVYPGPAHDPSIALVLAGSTLQEARWVDARNALILPCGGPAQAVIPSSTPPHPAFGAYLNPIETISLRPDDLDPQFTYYEIDIAALSDPTENIGADFGGAIILEGAQWFSPQVEPGETAELLTRWRIIDPAKAGPIHDLTGTTAAVIFAHVLDNDDQILAQKDTLDAPSWNWKGGDTILQIHAIPIPSDAQPGQYPVVLGIYDQPTGQRLPVVGNDLSTTTVNIPAIEVAQSPGSAQN